MNNNEKKIYTPLTINIQIYDVKTDDLVKEFTKVIDHRDRREWIVRTVMWATMNNCYLEICNNNDKQVIEAS